MSMPNLTEKQQFWFDHIQQSEDQKLSPTDYCTQENLVLQKFYSYKSELRKKGIRFNGDLETTFARAVTSKPTAKAPLPTQKKSNLEFKLDFHGRLLQLSLRWRLP